jgi:hypothetical protein
LDCPRSITSPTSSRNDSAEFFSDWPSGCAAGRDEEDPWALLLDVSALMVMPV